MQKQTSHLVIGAGSGGLTVAFGLHKAGKDVILVSETIGGDCTQFGCVPSKTLLHLADLYVKSSTDEKKRLHMNILSAVQKKIKHFEDEDLALMKDISFIQGRATFLDANTVTVKDTKGKTQTITFKKAVISTGSRPRMIEFPKKFEKKIITNEDFFYLKRLPTSITIIGGGPIGCELATACAKLDIPTTMVVRSKILKEYPSDMTKIIRNSLESLDVNLYENTDISDASLPQTEYYLLASGRAPNTELGLENAGVEYSPRGIAVNSQLQTSKRHIYALGDCTGGAQFTHLANNEGRAVTARLLVPFLRRKIPALPNVTFTDPPIAAVGRTTEDEFIQEFPLSIKKSDRAVITETTEIAATVYAHALTGQIVGAVLVGDFAEHAINFFTLAVDKKVKLFELSNVIVPYPTYLSSLNTLSFAYLMNLKENWKPLVINLLKKYSQKLIAIFFWVVTVVFFLKKFADGSFRFDILITDLATLLQGEHAYLLFIFIYALRPLIFFSATALSFLAGATFGFTEGLILTVIASNLSSAVAYGLGRTILHDVIKNSGKKIQKNIKKNTFETVLLARLVFVPYDLVSYIAGAVNAAFWPFISATAIGSIAGSIAVVSFGASVQDISKLSSFSLDKNMLFLGVGLTLVSLLLSRLLKKKEKVVGVV